MVNGVFKSAADPGDLALKRDDSRFEFGNGEAIEILTDQRGQRVVGAGRGLVHIHHLRSVDRADCDVNNIRMAAPSGPQRMRPTT